MGQRVTSVWGRHLICLGLLFAGCSVPERHCPAPTDPLVQTRLWLRQNPPDGTNRAARRERMAGLQCACDRLSVEDYALYARAWSTNAAQCDHAEQTHPALGYLRDATLEAIDEIRHTRVEKGMAVWQIYNMGHVFKTPTACFGIDLSGRRVEGLAPELDFLLTTHEHKDHYSEPLIHAMLQRGKPVVTRWFPGTTIVNHATNRVFGGIRVRIDIGDHHYRNPKQLNNMLMFEVSCGADAGNAVIYHCGDNSNIDKIAPSQPLDLLIVHASVGLPVAETIRRVNPRMTFPAHLLELGHSPHPPHAWRWSYDYAFDTVKEIPAEKTAVLTWGERWLLPGTRLLPPAKSPAP